MRTILHGDCIEQSEQIQSGSVDLILTDPPYGNMDTDGGKKMGIENWDKAIQPKQIFDIANRILRKNGKLILFSQEPYTSQLITNSIPNLPFGYRMIWEKDNFANPLGAKKAPVSYFEDILVFSKNHDTCDLHPLRDYLKECKKRSGLTNKQFNHLFSDFYNKQGLRDRSVLEHYWAASQFIMPTEEIYKEILQPTGYFPINFEEMKRIDDEFKNKFSSTFNLWEGKKYKSNILKYKKDYNGYHPTQKPVALLEDLIKTYSNEGNLVVDLTAGSGSTAVAAINTNRNFVVIEKEEKYFKIAQDRINKANAELKLF